MSTRAAPTTDESPNSGASRSTRTHRRPPPPYPPAFRKEAVALVQSGKGSIPQIAREVGVHQETLRLWVKQVQVDTGQRPGVTTDVREAQAEIARLRREVARLTAERDLLKEATAFFARSA